MNEVKTMETIRINAERGKAIPIGRRGENLAREVVFDISGWIEQYGPGFAALAAMRAEDEYPAPVAVEREGNTVTWRVSSTDTAMVGYGLCELRYYVGEVLAKAEQWVTYVVPALGDPDKVPDAAEDYIARMQRIGNAVQEAVAHAPIIGQNGNWWLWNTAAGAYVDSELPSRGETGDTGPQGPKGDNGGLTEEIKAALLTIAEKAGYSDTHGRDYYDALYAALYPPAELLSITASFVQGNHIVYDTDTLEDLKQYLTVTGSYDDGSSRAVTGYTLSGMLTEGVSTITVTADSKTTTFSVNVTHKVATLTGIEAVFTQGSATVYDTDSLDSLKQYLVVTASYDNGTSAMVNDYTLSGTLTVGTSTITATYSGFSDTFDVTVSKAPAQTVEMERLFVGQSSNSPFSTVYSDGGDTMLKDDITTAFASVETFSVDTVVEITITYGTTNANLKQYAASWDGSGDGSPSSPYLGKYGETIGSAKTTAYTATYTVKAGCKLLIKNYNAGVWQSLTVTKGG